MELRSSPGLSGEAASACEEYLDRLRLPPEARRLVLAQVGAETDPARAMTALHRILAAPAGAGATAGAGDPALASLRRRLQLAGPPVDGEGAGTFIVGDPSGSVRLVTTPPLCRTPIAPSAWPAPVPLRAWRAIRRLLERRRPERGRARPRWRPVAPTAGQWRRTAAIRRVVLTALVLGQTAATAYAMTAVLPHHGAQPLELAVLVLFTILFGWVSVGFWTGVVGFLVSLGRDDPHSIARSLAAGEIPPDARTAVIMPICNEHVGRVFAGLRASYVSLARTGALERFDFFVLSDSSDPDARVAETRAWLDLCHAIGGFGRIFYRWRRHRIKRKSGNVTDFCRRWGSRYRYIVVLDADSVMTGSCLTALVRLMEANPTSGMIQTAPRSAGRETLYARVQQFATRVYGPMFTAGLNFWHLGESYYWGHNAIIRVAPFMRHCALGRLPGRGVLSGEILSHDFVEAALMRRAGWAVWVAHDLPGSYEELPPNLIDESRRDRRWCQGNLINSRLFWAEGLHPAHRAVFMAGVMTYLTAPLWLTSLALSTALIVIQTVIGPRYFVQPRQLFPDWPEWHVEWAIALTIATASVLFLPKILAAALVLARGARDFGGSARLVLSLLCELVLSAVLAPIRMLFHTQFVLAAVTGWGTRWSSPRREDAETSWREALRRHGGHTALGIAWAAAVYRLAPGFVWWLLPTVGALAVSVPLSVYSSRVSLGRRFRRAGLLLIPEETRPPLELRIVRRCVGLPASRARFADAVMDPLVNAVACAAVPCRMPAPAVGAARARLVATAVREGPAALSGRDRMVLLSDPAALSQLHLEVWASPAALAKWRAEAAVATA